MDAISVKMILLVLLTTALADYRLGPRYKWTAGPRIAVLRGPPHVHHTHPHPHVHHHVHPPPGSVAAAPPPRLRRPVNTLDGGHLAPPPFALRPPPHTKVTINPWQDSGVRVPLHKEPFNPSPPSVQLPAVITSSSDDDKGPIHTIPAPNLSLDKPHRFPPSTIYARGPEYNIPSSTPSFPSVSHGVHFSSSHSHLETPSINVQPSNGYEVHEQTNDQAGYNLEGVPTYYAPDPDPSLPTQKVPAALEPHNVPSNNLPLPDVLGGPNQEADALNTLTSQDLFHLLHGVPPQGHQQQTLVDSYGLPVAPETQILYQQIGLGLPVAQGTPDNGLLLQRVQDFQPQFQTFSYEEQYQGSDSKAEQQYAPVSSQYEEQVGSDTIPRASILRKTTDSYQGRDDSDKSRDNVQPEQESAESSYYSGKVDVDSNRADETTKHGTEVSPSFYSQIGTGGSGVVSTSFYTTLPSREAALSLSSLQAAGSLNSKYGEAKNNPLKVVPSTRNTIQNTDQEDHAGDKVQEDDEVKKGSSNTQETKSQNAQEYEEHVEYVDYEDEPATNDNKDVKNEREKESSGNYHQPNHQQYSDYFQENYDDGTDEEDVGVSVRPLEFGARIRPK